MALDDSAPIVGASDTEAPGLDIAAPVAGATLFDEELAGLPREGVFGRAVKRASYQLASDLARSGEGLFKGLGMEGAKEYTSNLADTMAEKAGEKEARIKTPYDIKNATDASDYLKSTVGGMIPTVASVLPLAIFGARRASMNAIDKVLAGIAGAAVASFPPLFAQTFGHYYSQQKAAGFDDPGKAAKAALLPSALNVLIPGTISGMIMRPGAEVAKRTLSQILGRVVASSALLGTELGGVSYYSVRLDQEQRALYDPKFDINSEEAERERRSGAAAGLVSGAALGLPTGALHAVKQPPVKPAPPPPAALPAIRAEEGAGLRTGPPGRDLGAPLPEMPSTGSFVPTMGTDINPIDARFAAQKFVEANKAVPAMKAGIDAQIGSATASVENLSSYERNQLTAARARLDELGAEVPKSKGGARSKQDILKDVKATRALIDDLERNPPSAPVRAHLKELMAKSEALAGIGERPPVAKGKTLLEAVLSAREQEAQNAAQEGNFRRDPFGEYSYRNAGREAAEAGDRDRLLGATRSTEEGGQAPSAARNEARTQEVITARTAAAERTEQQVAGARERFASPVPQELLPAPPEMKLLTAPTEKVNRGKQRIIASAVEVTNAHVDNFVEAGLLKKEQGTAAKRIINNAVKAGLETGDTAKAKKTIEEGIKRALKGKVAAADMDTIITEFYTALVETHAVKKAAETAQPKLLSKAAVTSPTGMIYFSHWGDVKSGMLNPKMIGTGVKGRDQEPAKTMGVAYTSAVVRGAQYAEPEVQQRPQSVGMLRADRVFEARRDDPRLAEAFAKIEKRYGHDEALGWMQYLKDIHAEGKYDAILYGGGQLRLLTPQRVYPELDVVASLKQSDALLREHTGELQGFTTNLVTGADMRGTNTFGVSPYKVREEIIRGEPTKDQIEEFIARNSDLLAQPDHSFGSWHRNGDTYLDVTVSIPDMGVALELGRRNGQLAIWDSKAGVEIPIGHPLFDTAQIYNREANLPAMTPLNYIEPDARVMRQIASTYDQLLTNNPAEHVQQAYGVFAAEVKQQYDAISKVIKIEPWAKEGQPYDNSVSMRKDVFGNGHLFVYTGGEPHPLLTPEQNFQLRAVHDIFGHAKTGFEFGPRGELNAFRMHSQMFSDAAKPAFATETLAQNAAFNYGAANEGKAIRARAFPVQKVDLLPSELWEPLIADVRNSRAAQLSYIDNTYRQKGEMILTRMEELIGTPKGVEARLFVQGDPHGEAGSYTVGQLKDILSFAVNAKDTLGVADHESYHYLENRKLNEREQVLISDAFQPGKPMFDRVVAVLDAYDAKAGTDMGQEVRAKPQEARAYGFQHWKAGELEAPTWLGRAWEKISGVLERVKNMIDGLGFQNAQDIFRAIDRGEYARREARAFRVDKTADSNWFNDLEPDVFPSLKSGKEPVSSQAKGRPDWVKNGSDVTHLRNRLSVLAKEGEAYKDWYRESAEAIMGMYKGDKVQAETLAKLIAVFSPRTNVGEDLGHAMRAINQFRNDQPILTGRFPNKMSAKALQVLAGKEEEATVTGIKRNTFYRNMMMYIDPQNFNVESQGATVDMWISHLFGFGHSVEGRISKGEYRYAEAEIGRLATKMGWTIDQTQAAIWVSTKARWGITRAQARDWGLKHNLFESMKADDQLSLNFNEAGGGPPIKLRGDPASQKKFLTYWASLALNVKMDEGSLKRAGYNYANAIVDAQETGTIKPHKIALGDALNHGNEIAADGDARQFTLKFYSHAALDELSMRAQDGNEAQKQMYSIVAGLMEKAKLSEGQERSVLGDTVRGYTGGAVEGIKRFVDDISSGMQLSRKSKGFENVFSTLSNFLQRRNRIISEAVDEKLPTWRSADTTNEHLANASRAIMDRTNGNEKNPQGFAADSAEYSAIIGRLSEHEQRMVHESEAMMKWLLTSEFEIDKVNYAKVFRADANKAVAYLQNKQGMALDPVKDAGTKAYAEWLENRGAQVKQLINNGYIPERRYGDHGVGITMDINGRAVTLGWEQFQLRGQAAHYEAELRNTLKEYPELKVDYAFKYKAQYDGSISLKQFMDTARRFGVDLSQVERERIAKALLSADSTARNRIFRRKGVPGYSENGLRVLAEFATTMGHKIAYSEVGDALQDTLQGIAVKSEFRPDGTLKIDTYANTNRWAEDGELSGYYRNRADELVDFTTTPRQQSSTASFLRGAAAFNMLGASIASGFVNSLSLPMITVPYLTAHTGYVNALAKVLNSASFSAANWKTLTDIKKLQDRNFAIPEIDSVNGLRDGLIVGALNGKLLDTELYQIMGLTRGGVLAQSKTVQAAMSKWMFPFRYAEQVNRYGTFIAAWKIGIENGLRDSELSKFASDAVDSTQFRYDEANRPSLARTPVGAVLMIFKSWPIFYLEALRNLAKQDKGAAAAMLGSLALVSGIEGLPFAQDAENLIDTIAQRIFGSPFNTSRWMRNMTKNFSEAVVGIDASGALMHGLANEFTSASIASRQSMGQLIPGSNIGRADADYKQVLSSLLGPAGSMVQGWLSGVDQLSKGNYIEAVKKAAPLAVQNVAKAYQQWQSGYASNAAGQKLQDIGTLQPLLQFAGFSSSAVSNAYEIDRIDRQTTAFYNQTKRDMIHDIVQGILHDRPDQVNDTFALVTAWNRSHPDMPMAITGSTIRQQVLAAGLPLNERTLRKMPKALRGSSATFEQLYGSGS